MTDTARPAAMRAWTATGSSEAYAVRGGKPARRQAIADDPKPRAVRRSPDPRLAAEITELERTPEASKRMAGGEHDLERVVEDDTITGPDYAIDAGAVDEIDSVDVKSGTTRQTFPRLMSLHAKGST